MIMEYENFYVHRNVTNRSGPRTQSRHQTDGNARKRRGSRCLVLLTVGLALICVLLLVFIILQNFTITAERDLTKSYKNTAEELNQTINSLQDNYTHLKTERDQLQNNFNSLSQKNLGLESQVRSLSDQLNNKQGYLWGPDGMFVCNEEKSWSDSRQYCRDRGADLIIINTEEKQRHISSLIMGRVWIGLSDRQQEGNMKWVDNSPLKRGFWLKGEPNDAGGNEDCIELMPSNLVLNNWNDLSCSEKKKAICEKSGSSHL